MRHTHMDMDIDTGTCTRRDSDFEKKNSRILKHVNLYKSEIHINLNCNNRIYHR